MAQLKDSVITGSLRVTDTTYTNDLIISASKTKNKFLGTPSNADGVPTFRTLETSDIPTISITDKTSGTLTVARGGTGITTATNVNAVVIGNSSTANSAMQTVATASGAFYATGNNAKPAFGTLPIAQGGTGITQTDPHKVLIGPNPSSGSSAAAPTWRVLDGKDILNAVYPIGSIYMSVDSTSPATLFGGTWERLKDKFLLGAGDTYAINTSGGNASITLSTANLPSHTHTFPNTDITSDGADITHRHNFTTDQSSITHSHDTTLPISGGTRSTGAFYEIQNDGNMVSRATNGGGALFSAGVYPYNGSSYSTFTTNVGGGRAFRSGNNSGGDHRHSGTTGDGNRNHNHTVRIRNITLGSEGSGTAFDNLPPYTTVYIWKRTA